MKRFFLSLLALVPLAAACQDDIILTTAQPIIAVTPIANFTDASGSIEPDKNKINMGETPLYSGATAIFEVKNIGQAPLMISSITCKGEGNVSFTPSAKKYYADSIAPLSTEDNRILIKYLPLEEWADNNGNGIVDQNELDIGVCTIESNASNGDLTLTITGYGKDKGYPDLQVCFDTYCGPKDDLECYSCSGTNSEIKDQCAGQVGDVCITHTMDFGNVGLCPNEASQFLTLKNVASCPRDEGVGICDAESLCLVSIDEVQFYSNIVTDVAHRFSINGSTNLPLYLNQPEYSANRCDDSSISEIKVPIVYDSSCTETQDEDKLIIKSNDPRNPTIIVPLTASSKEGPIAICSIREGEGYTNSNNIVPLKRIYFDGSHSRAPNARDDAVNNGITRYEWRITRYPDGANTNDFAQMQTDPYFDFYLPIAGEYQVALTVYDSANTASAVTEKSVCSFNVVPASKMHIQLVWDNVSNDQDLHLMYIEKDNKFCSKETDCYWSLREPIWFEEDGKGENGNPRLDIDDTFGMGPENINIDKPRPGRYRVFVQYYAPVTGITDTRNTVRIYINGLQQAEYHRTLNKLRQVWAVADIIWDEAGNGKVVPLDTDTTGEVGWLCEDISCDSNNICESPF